MVRRSVRKNAFYLMFQLGFTKSDEELKAQKLIFFEQVEEEFQRRMAEQEEKEILKKEKAIAQKKADYAIEKAVQNSIKNDDEYDDDGIDLFYDEEDEELQESNSDIEADEEKSAEDKVSMAVDESAYVTTRRIYELTTEDKQFILRLVDGTVDNIFEIDETINDNSNGWSVSRMNRVEATVLRIAVYELAYDNDMTPKGVVINEAVELAKRFSTEKAGGFVNGILGSVVKNIESMD